MAADYVPERLLITGGAGFIGSHVVLRLARLYPEYKVRHPRATAQACAPGKLTQTTHQIFVMDSLEYCANLKHLRSLQRSPNFKVPATARSERLRLV